MNGEFENRRKDFGIKTDLQKRNVNECCRWIREQKWKILCINDNEKAEQFEVMKTQVRDAFETVLPERSSYER